jgi:glycosyltransferase involved in cell wall biosynthesis
VTAGFFSPLPPARTGVADYSAALLSALRRLGDVQVAPDRCDVRLYHLGNNQLHAAIYSQALERPGVVVLHDAVLHHFFLGSLPNPQYVDEFVYNYGEWNRSLATELWRNRARAGGDPRYFSFPMLKRIAERSLAVVVHNPAAARAVREHAPAARVVEIPHLYQEPPLPSGADVIRYRQRLGVPQGSFVFGIFGYLRESKRLMTAFEAFQDLHAEHPDSRLLMAGTFASSDLERTARRFAAEPWLVRLHYLAEAEFRRASCVVDACINLRYPAAGESSGITIRLMGLGKPVLVTDAEEVARFPEGSCIRIPPGLEERASLSAHMVLLTSLPEVSRAIGRRGAEHIRAHHHIEQIARQYWNLLCEYRG